MGIAETATPIKVKGVVSHGRLASTSSTTGSSVNSETENNLKNIEVGITVLTVVNEDHTPIAEGTKKVL